MYINKSVLDMATVQCNFYDIVEQMKSFWRASNGSGIIISICFFLYLRITHSGYQLILPVGNIYSKSFVPF